MDINEAIVTVEDAIKRIEAYRELIRKLVAALEKARHGYIDSSPTAFIIDAALAAAKERRP